jgi:hypothetical protein
MKISPDFFAVFNFLCGTLVAQSLFYCARYNLRQYFALYEIELLY